MTTPLHAMLTGSFVSNGNALNISLPSGYDYFELVNTSDVGDAGATTQVMRAKSYGNIPAGSAYLNLKTNGAATLALESMITANGFTFIADSALTANGAIVANITNITNAAQSVVSTITPVPDGSVVRLFNTTGALQLAGMDYTTGGSVPVTSFNLVNVATAPGSAGTGGSFMVVGSDGRYAPRTRYITGISNALQAVVALSVTHNYTVGQKVRIKLPTVNGVAQYGMGALNNQLVTIVAVGAAYGGTTNTITINYNTLGLPAFAYPASALAATGVSFPLVSVPSPGAHARARGTSPWSGPAFATAGRKPAWRKSRLPPAERTGTA